MKKIILSSVIAVAAVSGAHAASQSICSGAPSNAQAVSAASDGSLFVRVGFTPKCSQNVHLVGDDNATYYRVGAASTKGKNYFGGSSVGGAVQAYGTCASATICTSTDASNGANSAASS